LTTSSYHK